MRNTVLRMYKDNAKKTGKLWTLTNEQAFELFAAACYYCDKPPSRTAKRADRPWGFTYNRIDRKHNSGDYTIENSVTACTTCNVMKSSQGYEEFVELIHRISKHLGEQKDNGPREFRV